MASEEQLIERVGRKVPSQRLARRLASTGGPLRVGIGDDAAVIRPGGRSRSDDEWVITTDAFIENVHFLLRVQSPRDAGYKALARAASDLAAMGARPRYFFMNLALPASCTGKWLDDFLDGMSRAARKFGLVLAGGDTTKDSRVAINLTLLGSVAPGRAVLRSGARPGDLLCVSGRLGEAELGLQLAAPGLRKDKRWNRILQKHFRPEPRLALGEWLAESRLASAMIDVSDGLSTDLAHICKASGVGALVQSGKIPKVIVPERLRKPGLDPLLLALHGGEDYELLFTVPKRLARGLPPAFGGVPLTIIGEITRGKRILVVDPAGRARPLRAKGWDPFRYRG